MVKVFKILLRISDCLVMVSDFLVTDRITVIGDSHVYVFKDIRLKLRFPNKKFNICAVGGATVSGLENPNPITQAYKIFINKLNALTEDDVLIIMLGEVDTGFVIWYRAEKYKASVDEMLNLAIENYTNFLLKAKFVRKLIVISTPLPTIRDDADLGEVANLRREVKASQKERTELTLKFNRLIREFCEAEEIIFIDLDIESLGQDNIVDKKLLNKCKSNHHYDPTAYTKLLKAKLKEVI